MIVLIAMHQTGLINFQYGTAVTVMVTIVMFVFNIGKVSSVFVNMMSYDDNTLI